MAKILWFSPHALHDSSSGAANKGRIMLQELSKKGFEVKALGSLIFDNPCGNSMFTDLNEKLNSDIKIFNTSDKGVDYIYTKTAHTSINKWNYEEQNLLYVEFQKLLRLWRPDLVMGFGGDCVSMALRAELQRRGIPSVYVLCNGNHQNYSFFDCDLVVTDSNATAQFYANNFGINVQVMGQFLSAESVKAESKNPKYITFINPDPSKGVALVARLALMAQKELPDERFLIVKSRGDFAASVQALHFPDNKNKKLSLSQFKNVDVAENSSNVKPIYAASKVLLAPSLCYESWGRVATEAVINTVPVLASKSGGLPEAMGDGGICLDAPKDTQKDWLRIPTEKEMRPWMDALKRLLTEDWTEACIRGASSYDLNRSTETLIRLLTPLLNKNAGANPQYLRSGVSIR